MSRRRETPLDAQEKRCSHEDALRPIQYFGLIRRNGRLYYRSWCKFCLATAEQARRIARRRGPLHVS